MPNGGLTPSPVKCLYCNEVFADRELTPVTGSICPTCLSNGWGKVERLEDENKQLRRQLRRVKKLISKTGFRNES